MNSSSIFSSSALALLVGVVAGCGQQPDAVGTSRQALSTTLVISQVYTGGGESGAPYKSDFIEIFNLGTTPVSLANKSLQYASAATTPPGWTLFTLPATATILPGGYYLVKMAGASGGVGLDLPTPDATGSFAMSASQGRVALVNGTTEINCGGSSNCTDPLVIDFLGYGGARHYEGTGPTDPVSFTAGAKRGGEGCVETDNNAADFSITAPTPRNSASPVRLCSAIDAGPDATDGGDAAIADAPVLDAPMPVDGAVVDTGAGDGAASDTAASVDTGAAGDSGSDDTGTIDDGATADTEPTADTGMTADTGTLDDTGTTAAPAEEDSGCGCIVAGRSDDTTTSAFLAAIVGLGVVARRRRR